MKSQSPVAKSFCDQKIMAMTRAILLTKKSQTEAFNHFWFYYNKEGIFCIKNNIFLTSYLVINQNYLSSGSFCFLTL